MNRARVETFGCVVALCCAAWIASPGLVHAQLVVAAEERVYIDSSRPTRENGTFPGAPDRTLRTRVWIPEATCTGPGSCPPFPLLLMAHGFGGLPEKFEAFARTVAGEGYVVAAPAFPLTNQNAPGGHLLGLSDVANQADDLVFVTQRLIGDALQPADSLAGLLEPEALSVLGHSLGGATVLGLLQTDCCPGPAFRAAILVASLTGFNGVFGQVVSPGPTSMILHGTSDPVIPFATAEGLFETFSLPRYLVGIAGGGHAEQLESQVEPAIAARDAAQRATLGFLDARFRGRGLAFAGTLTALEGEGHTVISEIAEIPLFPGAGRLVFPLAALAFGFALLRWGRARAV